LQASPNCWIKGQNHGNSHRAEKSCYQAYCHWDHRYWDHRYWDHHHETGGQDYTP